MNDAPVILAHRYLGIARASVRRVVCVRHPDDLCGRYAPTGAGHSASTNASARSRARPRHAGRRGPPDLTQPRPHHPPRDGPSAYASADASPPSCSPIRDLLGDVSQSDSPAIAARFTGVPQSALHYARELDTAISGRLASATRCRSTGLLWTMPSTHGRLCRSRSRKS
jgi:hypothetical protein